MSLFYKAIEDVNLADLQRLVLNEVYESRQLDYKQELLDPTASGDAAGKAKREFLYDVSAMANSGGGDLLYGVEEERVAGKPSGRPAAISGVVTTNPDALRLALEHLILDGIEPRIVGFRVRFIRAEDGRYVFLIRTPRSLNAPHMVSMGGTQRFYARDSGGKHPMEIAEIRAAFLASASIAERAEAWRSVRRGKLLPLASATRVVLHLIPLAFADVAHPLDVRRLEEQRSNLLPLSMGRFSPSATRGFEFRFNVDGYLTYQRTVDSNLMFTYVQFFRTGQIEAVDTGLLQDKHIHSAEFEKALKAGAERYLAAMRDAGVQPPIILAVSLLSVRGFTMQTTRALPAPVGTGPIEEDDLVLPGVLLEEWDTSVGGLLRPVFDSVWNACGWPFSPNYDEAGEWRAYQGAYLIDE